MSKVAFSRASSTVPSRTTTTTCLSGILKSGIMTNHNNVLELMTQTKEAKYKLTFQSKDKVNQIEQTNKMIEVCDLNCFLSYLFSTILEDALAKIRILGNCTNDRRLAKTKIDMPQLLAEKYGMEEPTQVDELAGVISHHLDKEEYKINKLTADLQYLEQSLCLLYMDLTLNKTFESLVQQIAIFYERDTHYADLIEAEDENRLVRRELARQVRFQRNRIRSANYDADVAIDKLVVEIEESAVIDESRSRFIDRLQKARCEQHKQSLKDIEANPLDKTVFYKHKLDREQRAHGEVMMLMSLILDDTLDKIDNIMNKYEIDMEDMDMKIERMKNTYQEQRRKRMELEERYIEHEKEARDWIAYKQDRQNACLHRVTMEKSAIVLQAWWRGILVRMQLGPYRPPKKKPWRPGRRK